MEKNDVVLALEKNGAIFFATGGSQMELGLDLNYIPHAQGRGVNLSGANQTLQQSFQIAKQIFEQVELGTIKFVLIGLSPYVISANDKEPPVVCAVEEKVLEDYFKLCVDNGAKPVCVVLPVNAAVKKTYNAGVLKAFRDTINNVVKKHKATFIDLLDVGIDDKLFKDKAHLNSEGSAAVSVLLSERLYLKGILSPQDLCVASNDFFNLFSKHFPRDHIFPNDDKPLIHHVFCKMAYEDFSRLSETMPKETCMDLMAQVFSELTYSYLTNLADILPKGDYIELTTRLFKMTVENIRRKNKIKVGFYFEFSSHWCGDDLYNAFAKDERFDPIIFAPIDYGTELNRNEFLNDSKKFKARGLNVFEMKVASTDIPKQDILFRFRPYPEYIPPAFRLTNIKIKETLLTDIPYSFFVDRLPAVAINLPLYNVLWKKFFPSTDLLERYKQANKLGMPRGIYSGYPKQDIFFKPDAKFYFEWKMMRPDAKKIIWAPHWSIAAGVQFATFQWNYKFMYEFAKTHPEFSWVVKPHPLLFMSAKWTKIFSSDEALKEYFQKWDDLPNARFYTGTYYQGIFATSDGMIHDSDSFIAEYQYVNKPMIFLTRDTQKFNELGNEILKASYTVDGKDLDGIAAMMQRVFIEGDDYKAAERKEVFDKYLNYPKANGMLASEFIYKNIADELK